MVLKLHMAHSSYSNSAHTTILQQLIITHMIIPFDVLSVVISQVTQQVLIIKMRGQARNDFTLSQEKGCFTSNPDDPDPPGGPYSPATP